jgi:hypothetical protein
VSKSVVVLIGFSADVPGGGSEGTCAFIHAAVWFVSAISRWAITGPKKGSARWAAARDGSTSRISSSKGAAAGRSLLMRT